MSKFPLYDDKYIQIFDDKIRFKSWVLPWGKKDVKISHIKKISERNIGLSGRLRVSGSSNFRETGFIMIHQGLQRKKQLFLKLILKYTKDCG